MSGERKPTDPQPGDPIAYVCGVPVYSHEGVDWNEPEGE